MILVMMMIKVIMTTKITWKIEMIVMIIILMARDD